LIALQVAHEGRGAMLGPGVFSRRTATSTDSVPFRNTPQRVFFSDWEMVIDEKCEGIIIVESLVPPLTDVNPSVHSIKFIRLVLASSQSI
jgi:hypothetical protein